MKRPIALLSILPFLLSSCSYKGEHLLIKNGDYESMIELSSQYEVDKLLNCSFSYALFYGLKGCSSCEQTKEALNKYVNKNHQLIYYVDSTNAIIQGLDISTLYLYDEAQLFASISYSSLKSPIMIKNNLSKYYKDSDIYVFYDRNKYEEFYNTTACISLELSLNDMEQVNQWKTLIKDNPKATIATLFIK